MTTKKKTSTNDERVKKLDEAAEDASEMLMVVLDAVTTKAKELGADLDALKRALQPDPEGAFVAAPNAVSSAGLKVEKPAGEPRPISSDNKIKIYFHCKQCLASMPIGESPGSWARLEGGLTEVGFQIRCKRHNLNIIHVDFDGAIHRANTKG